MGRMTKECKEKISKATIEIKALSEKVNDYLYNLDFAIKMEPGNLWFVADLKESDYCVSPKLKDLEALHRWVGENYRKLKTARTVQEQDA